MTTPDWLQAAESKIHNAGTTNGQYYWVAVALLEHCLKLREVLDKAGNHIAHDGKPYLGKEALLKEIDEALSHKPEGVL